MSKMHGPDQDRVLISPAAPGEATHSMTLADLYKIIYDRLDYVRIKPVAYGPVPLSALCDIEAVTQQAMVEVRKKLGLYKDELDARWTADNVAKTDAEGSHPPMSAPQNCNRWIQTHKPQQVYPRTCARCGFGPCPFAVQALVKKFGEIDDLVITVLRYFPGAKCGALPDGKTFAVTWNNGRVVLGIGRTRHEAWQKVVANEFAKRE